MKIPYDSLTLAAVVAEIEPLVGAKIQKVSQPDAFTVVVELYGQLGLAELLVSCDPVFARMHLSTRKAANPLPTPGLCTALRSHLAGSALAGIRQIGFDRVVHIDFDGPKGRRRLIAELMGKHSNLVFLDDGGRILSAAKVVGPQKSKRPIIPGHIYAPPPFEPRRSLLAARPGDDLKQFEGASSFLIKLIEADPDVQADVVRRVRQRDWSPCYAPDEGAYPISVDALGMSAHPRASISVALEQHFALAIPKHFAEQLKASLTGRLKRVVLARETALADLAQAAEAARKAGDLQMRAELILAYGPSLPGGSSVLDTVDYDGRPIAIRLSPELSYLENAQRLFEKAKRAKSGSQAVGEQSERITADKADLESLLAKLETASSLAEVEAIQVEARKRRWLHEQHTAKSEEKERPYEGHKIRELMGPRGYRVLYGENATSNDYLTSRVAKPNDIWLHVRGAVSAHVVIATANHPERVGPDVLEFAAKVAVQNSVAKHSGFVPVDYTLKKHVRKPRGSAPGLAVYVQEKTLHLDSR